MAGKVKSSKPQIHDDGGFDDFFDWRECPVALPLDDFVLHGIRHATNNRHERLAFLLDQAVRQYLKEIRLAMATRENDNALDDAWKRYQMANR